MNSTKRRAQILDILKRNTTPIKATSIALVFGVSRQVIVGDIALLRASGKEILSTQRGYLLASINKSLDISFQIVTKHSQAETLFELYAIVDNGGIIKNVIIEHPIYGLITAELNITSRLESDQFFKVLNSTSSVLLSSLTDGIHIHTVECSSEENKKIIKEKLMELNYLIS